MLNKILLQGRLVADPELRQTPGGVSVVSFRIAVDRDFKNKETGEKEADFVNIVAWQSTAEFVSRFFSKGRLILIEGRLQIRNYTDREGNKRTVAEVVANNVYFSDSRRDNESGGGYSAPPPVRPAAPDYGAPAPSYGTPAPSYGTPAPAGDQFSELSEDDGELPF